MLPADTRLNDLARLYLKADKYMRQNSGGNDASRRAILEQRGQQNAARRGEMITLANDFLSRATLFLNGGRWPVDQQAVNLAPDFAKALQELIAFAYPSLKMLKGSYDEKALSKTLLDPDDLIEGTERLLTEAEAEILTYVRRNQDDGQRTFIEEMVREFGRRPYGWYPMAVLTLVARLFRMGKVELRDPGLLDAQGAHSTKMRSSRQHGRCSSAASGTYRAGTGRSRSRTSTTISSIVPMMALRHAQSRSERLMRSERRREYS